MKNLSYRILYSQSIRQTSSLIIDLSNNIFVRVHFFDVTNIPSCMIQCYRWPCRWRLKLLLVAACFFYCKHWNLYPHPSARWWAIFHWLLVASYNLKPVTFVDVTRHGSFIEMIMNGEKMDSALGSLGR